MTYRRLGDSDLTVSVVGIGTNAFSRRVDQDGVDEIVAAAREVGVTFIDTADAYGATDGASEEMIGEALQGQRDEFVVATKFGGGQVARERGPGGSRRYVVEAVEGSLRRLRTDHIDLYQYHFPDGVTPIEETLSALTDLVRAGKVRYVGCSNLAAWQVADADWTARTGGHERFVSAQNRYSLLDRRVEDELVPACEAFGLGLLPYFPLAYGLLTGKYQPRRASARGLPRGTRRRPGAVAGGRRLGPDRGLGGVRREARPRPARRGHRRPRRPTGGGVRDLRRDRGATRCARTPPRCGGSRRPPTSRSWTW